MIDREFFFSQIRPTLFGGTISQQQVDGCTHLLSVWEAHYGAGPLEYLAYALATAYWETARTLRPIAEYGHGKGRAYGSSGFYGRGYVQLTWEANYRRASAELAKIGIKVDLVADREKALDPDIAAHILFLGMIQGWFTGRKLADYIPADPVGARRIINGTDKAETIAGFYREIVPCLRTVAVKVEAPKVETVAPEVVADVQSPTPGFWSRVHTFFSRKA